MREIHNSKIGGQEQGKKSNSKRERSPNSEEIDSARTAATRTKEQIYNYIKEKSNTSNSPFDIDGDGRVTDHDGSFIKAYLKEEKRGVDLREFTSPYVNSSLSSIASMEAKVAALIDNKTLDLNGNGKVDGTDGTLAEENLSKFAREDSSAKLSSLITTGLANVNGDAVTDQKDIALMKAYFEEGKRGDALKAVMGTGSNLTPAQLEAKLSALGSNINFDSNSDGKKDLADVNKLNSILDGVNHSTEVQERKDNLDVLMNSGALDVNGDGKINNVDMNLIKAYKKGLTSTKAQSIRGTHSSLNGNQIMGKLRTLYNSKGLDINKNGKNGGSLDMARISKAIEEKMVQERHHAIGEGPSQPPSAA